MIILHTLLVTIHISIGALVLVLFWIPAIAKKGSPLHVRAGRIYAIAMYAVATTAFLASILALIDPIGIRRPGEVLNPEQAVALASGFRMFSLFLLMLSVLVFTSLRHGIAASRERKEPGVLNQYSHKAGLGVLAVLAVVVGSIGIRNWQLLLIIFAGISFSAAITMYRDVRKHKPKNRELVVAHFNGLIGSGIGAYTAFFAFGGARFFADVLTGQLQVIPWVLPAIVGTFAINRLRRTYEQRRA